VTQKKINNWSPADLGISKRVTYVPAFVNDLPEGADCLVIAEVLKADTVDLQYHISRLYTTIQRYRTPAQGEDIKIFITVNNSEGICLSAYIDEVMK